MTCAGECESPCEMCSALFTRTCFQCGKEYIRSFTIFDSCSNCPEEEVKRDYEGRKEDILRRQEEAHRLLDLLLNMVDQ